VSQRPEFSSLSSAEKDALIGRLLAQVEELTQRLVALEAANAALRKENMELSREAQASADDAGQFEHAALAGPEGKLAVTTADLRRPGLRRSPSPADINRLPCRAFSACLGDQFRVTWRLWGHCGRDVQF
jgi:hypothetical protein